ncbi:MAG: MotA/TolQ/ExbB proton channel family protein [Desulfobacteraceae bacterium]|nr:MAG: MotA/TolQ/ExbB proton channel family protein [Desulfobacteraceae bacterium]
MITTQVSIFAFHAARVILVLLLLLSFCSIAFFIERMLYFNKHFLDKPSILPELEAANSIPEIIRILDQYDTSETRVIRKGLGKKHRSEDSFTKIVAAYFCTEKEKWERYTNFLGTVGSNAPFIGLLGTVLGILKSFADLGINTGSGPQVVMAGISEALIVTAVGLAVAIPAVIFFNICKTKIKAGSVRVESIQNMICSKNLFSESSK